MLFYLSGARCSVDGWRCATVRKAEVSSPDDIIEFIFFNLPNPGVYSTSKRNGYQGVKLCRRIRLTTSTPSGTPLSWQYGILNISQPYRPPRPVTGMALLFYFCVSCSASLPEGNVSLHYLRCWKVYEYFEVRKCPSVMFKAEMCGRSVGPSATQNNRLPRCSRVTSRIWDISNSAG
jgi:hypothetical protein